MKIKPFNKTAEWELASFLWNTAIHEKGRTIINGNALIAFGGDPCDNVVNTNNFNDFADYIGQRPEIGSKNFQLFQEMANLEKD